VLCFYQFRIMVYIATKKGGPPPPVLLLGERKKGQNKEAAKNVPNIRVKDPPKAEKKSSVNFVLPDKEVRETSCDAKEQKISNFPLPVEKEKPVWFSKERG